MRDLRVITAKALLQVSAISPIRQFYPPSLMVMGKDLDKAAEVELNGIACDEYIIQDSNRMIVKIPRSQVGQPLSSLKVYTPLSGSYSAAKVEMGIARPSKTVAGINRLVQAWLLIFFTTPGSDIFDQNSGGGARSLIGRATDAGHQSVAADLALCIDRTKTEMLRLQARASGIPLEERLLSSSLDEVKFDSVSSTLFARVSLRNMAGDAAQLALG